MKKTRRTVGAVAALATVLGGGSLFAVAAPSSAETDNGIRPASDVLNLLHSSTGAVSGIVPKTGLPLSLDELSLTNLTGALLPEQAAQLFVDNYADRFGVQSRDLHRTGTVEVGDGEAVKYQQYIEGLPVVAGELVASVTDGGKLQSLYGETAKGALDMPSELVGVDEASAAAREYVAEKTGVPADELNAGSDGRWVYNPELLNAHGLPVNREVYKFTVTNHPRLVDYTVLVDRGLGSVSLGFDNNHEALNREVCDAGNQEVQSNEEIRCDGEALSFDRKEGESESGVADVDAAYDKLGETAHWYASYADLDVTELIGPKSSGDKRVLRATTRSCVMDQQDDCPMPNAFWAPDLKQMYFGDGWVTSDVMAHELTHGVTTNTSNLYYIYQSGAINESQSDVFGEIIDLAANPEKQGTDAAWTIGDDVEKPGPFSTPLRSMSDPTSVDSPQPDTMTSEYYDDDAEFRDRGGVHTNSGVGNKAAYLIAEGGEFNGQSIEGLGLAKTFKIYWTSQNLLTSGSDYKDLFHILPLSCRKNVGKEGTYITESDCEQVDKAVRATEMYKDAAKAAPVATSYCEEGTGVHPSYSIKWDKGLGDWSPSGGSGRMKADLGVDYVQSGTDSLGLFSQTGGPSTGSAKSSAKTIPANSMLRIDYSTTFGLAEPTDGAKFAVAYNDGSGWSSAANLPSVNPGPWTSSSLGWSSAKYDLSSLEGKDVKFRVTVQGELGSGNAALAGVDNFKIYTCG